MKKILSHFRISIMLGVALLATLTSSKTINIITEVASVINVAGEESSHVDDSMSAIQPDDQAALPDDSESKLPTDHFVFTSDLIIKAINPGYTTNGTQNVGEFIELQKTTDTPLSLANYSIRYITSSGKSTILLNFSEDSLLVGEFLLVRLARSPESDQADSTYMTTIAMGAGTIEVVYNDEVVDSLCWASSSDTCSAPFKSSKPTSLVRDIETNIFEHLNDYIPNFSPDKPAITTMPSNPPEGTTIPGDESALPDDSSTGDSSADDLPTDDSLVADSSTSSSPEVNPVSARCYGLEFSEIMSYYNEDASEQFIEIYNPTERDIDLSFCNLRYKNKIYSLSGIIKSNAFLALYPTKFLPSFTLTKNPNSSNTIELIDADQSIVDILVYSHGQKKSTSYAKFYDSTGAEIWQLTYAITPHMDNNYQEFRTCPEGKVINPDTGNCVKVTATIDSAATECPAGKYRNPLTGRCKNIESTSTEPKPCAEGYERNPETNRCRKIVAENSGAGYALVPTTSSSKSTFIALGAVILIVSLGTIYIVLQFRHEIARAFRKIRKRLHHIR